MLQGDLRIPGILAYIEKSTAFVRGKGKKTLPVLDICYDVAEEDFVSTTSSHLQESPKLLILMNNNTFEMAVIKCDERVIFTQAADAAQALIGPCILLFSVDIPTLLQSVHGVHAAVYCRRAVCGRQEHKLQTFHQPHVDASIYMMLMKCIMFWPFKFKYIKGTFGG